MQQKLIKFNKQNLTLTYRSEADLSVIDEIFVDKMYRALEPIIPTLTYPILDIGAHLGLFSIYATVLNSKLSIIALEPEPTNFELMKKNLQANHCKNVAVKQMALIACHPELVSGSLEATNVAGKMLKQVQHDNFTTTLYLNEDSHNHSTFYESDNTLEVPATTLEQIITKNKLDKIGLLKMDIEGAEFEILKSLESNTWNQIQYLAVEYHEFKGNKRHDLENLIRSHGFSVEHFPNHFDKRFGLFICRNKKTA